MASEVFLDTETIGSSGTLIGAAMESSGHYMQGVMLELFDAGLATSLGSMLLLVALISAVFMIAVGGSYKYGMWLLFGPAVFFWFINVRTPSTGADWRFGTKQWDQRNVHEVASGAVGTEYLTVGSGEPVMVSFVFAEWNKVVSNVVQFAVSLFEITKESFPSNLEFSGRGDRYLSIFHMEPTNPGMILISDILLGNQCGEYFNLMRWYHSSQLVSRRSTVDRKLMEYESGQKNIPTLNLNEHPEVLNWLSESGYFDAVKLELGWTEIPTLLTCEQSWQMSVAIFKAHSLELIDLVLRQGIPESMPAEQAAETVAKRRDELLRKFKEQTIENQWKDQSVSEIDNPDSAFIFLLNEAAGRMLLSRLSTISQSSNNAVNYRYAADWDNENEDHNTDVALGIRDLSAGVEYNSKADFLTSMLTLPYVQGLALFFLAWSFPFFCFLLLIPGREQTLLLWFGLWFWVKSWDIGFAIVMLCDRFLYMLLPHGPPIHNEEIYQDPGAAFKAMLEVDPTYSVYTYYNILAVLIGAIPVISGILIGRGGSEIVDNLNRTFNNFGGRVGLSMGQYQRSLIVQSQAGLVRAHIYNELNDTKAKSLANSGYSRAMGEIGFNTVVHRLTKEDNLNPPIQAKIIDAEKKRQGAVAKARFKADLQLEGYAASTDAFTRGIEARSAMLGLFAKRYARGFFGKVDSALLDVYKESRNPHIGNTTDNIWEAVLEHRKRRTKINAEND